MEAPGRLSEFGLPPKVEAGVTPKLGVLPRHRPYSEAPPSDLEERSLERPLDKLEEGSSTRAGALNEVRGWLKAKSRRTAWDLRSDRKTGSSS